MDNLHDKQSQVSERQYQPSIEFLQDRVENWKEEILSYARELADDIPASGLMQHMNEVISYALDASENGVEGKSILRVLWSLNNVLCKAGTIIELVSYIKREEAQITNLSNSQPSTSK